MSSYYIIANSKNNLDLFYNYSSFTKVLNILDKMPEKLKSILKYKKLFYFCKNNLWFYDFKYKRILTQKLSYYFLSYFFNSYFKF